jgi:hypothetical protein
LKEKEALAVQIEAYQMRVVKLERELADAREQPDMTSRSQQLSARS